MSCWGDIQVTSSKPSLIFGAPLPCANIVVNGAALAITKLVVLMVSSGCSSIFIFRLNTSLLLTACQKACKYANWPPAFFSSRLALVIILFSKPKPANSSIRLSLHFALSILVVLPAIITSQAVLSGMNFELIP